MRTIVCYGDSNTWGSIPGESDRHPWHVRWPGAMQQQLGTSFRVIEEGLPGRTTCWDDPLDWGRNGTTYLPIVLETHAPIDLLIIMLGTNDVKARFNFSAFAIAQGASELLQVAKKFEPKIPEILLVAPPSVVKTCDSENTLSFVNAIDKSKDLSQHYSFFAERHGCHFLDGSTKAVSSPIDGIHLEADQHHSLAEGIASKVRQIFQVND